MSISVSPKGIRRMDALAAPLRAWFSPRFHGLENIPTEGPALLVANHSLVALDGSLLMHEILRHHGRVLRGLGDHALMASPRVRRFVQRMGTVRGTRANCRALLENGQLVLVLPGGSREALRRKHETYVLKWEGRTGFAHTAIAAGVPIVPVAMIGSNDAFPVLVDGQHALMRPLRWLAKATGSDPELTPPLFHGIGPTFVPKPERFYYSVGEPIETTAWRDTENPAAAATELQSLVRKALEEELTFLLAERDCDRGRTLRGRVLEALGR
jgi:1-acyl-sn-glycerol-3-phosphate acyltransferase